MNTKVTPEQRKQANRIAGRIKEYGYTQRQIARMCNVRENYIYMVLVGQRTGYERIRPVIAKVCQTTIADLWPDTPPQYREAA